MFSIQSSMTLPRTTPHRRRARSLAGRVALAAALVAGAAVADEQPSALEAVPVEAPAAAPPEPAGMRAIFNGRDLDGWDGDARMWSVRDGAIRGETTEAIAARGNTFLVWRGGTTGDFELRLSFRSSAANNSGIQYRSRHVTEGSPSNDWVVRGYQHEIRNERDLPNVAGFIYDEGGKRGRICLVGERATWVDGARRVDGRLVDQEGWNSLFRLDDWNDVVIVALQLHAGKPMWAEYRNIRLKSL